MSGYSKDSAGTPIITPGLGPATTGTSVLIGDGNGGTTHGTMQGGFAVPSK